MKAINIFKMFLYASLIPVNNISARPVETPDIESLFRNCEKAFIGTIESMQPFGKTIELIYPTWGDSDFRLMEARVEVTAPIKGVQSGDSVNVMMLAHSDPPKKMINPPGIVTPTKDGIYLFFLSPTDFDGIFASVTAPIDDNQGILLLDRSKWTRATYYRDGKEVEFHEQNDRNAVLWNLIDDEGSVNFGELERVLEKYKESIAAPPSGAIIRFEENSGNQ